MADTKISQLPTGTYNANDYIVVVDVTTSPFTSKKIPLSAIPSGGTVTPYSATFNASYATTRLPFYNAQTTSIANWTISAVGTTTATAATISDGSTTVNITSGTSGTTQALLNTGLTLGGSCTGQGSDGTSRTIPFSGSVPAIPIYTPAFYAQTATSTPPTFTIGSNQTAAGAAGSSITYPAATATTQYNWICTQRALSNIFVSTNFGPVLFNPDVTGPIQTISGQTFNVFGVTNLIVNQALTLTIT